jgi:HSP20 family protein
VRDHKNPFSGRQQGGASRGGAPVDVLVTPDQYLIEVDLPGVALEDVEVTVDGSELTIHAIRKRPEQTATKKDYAFLERKFGDVSRTIALPGIFGAELAKTLANGVLTIVASRKGTHEQLS